MPYVKILLSLSDIFERIGNTLNVMWVYCLHILTQDGSELRAYGRISLYATLVASVTILVIMLYYKPKTPLEGAFFLREFGIAIVIGILFSVRYFDWFSRPLLIAGYTLLAVSAIGIVVAIITEHSLTQEQIDDILFLEEQKEQNG